MFSFILKVINEDIKKQNVEKDLFNPKTTCEVPKTHFGGRL